MADVRFLSRQFLTEFIELYRSFPCLWKVKSKEYRDRKLKHTAYGKLVKKLSEVEPFATRDMVIKKINSLRTNRRKEKKKINDSIQSGAESVYKSSLWYLDLMSFLDDQETPLQPISNFEEHISTEFQVETDNSQTESVASTSRSSTVTSPPHRRSSLEDFACYSVNSQTRGPTPRHKKRMRQVDDAIVSIDKRLTEKNTEDQHDIFARNVAMKLRNLPNDQRIYLEKIINEAIFEAELGNLNRNCFISIPGYTTQSPRMSSTNVISGPSTIVYSCQDVQSVGNEWMGKIEQE